MNSNAIIGRYLETFSGIEGIDFIRFGTRVPVTFPQRVYDDEELLNLFEEQGDEFIETVWLAPGMGRSAKKAEQFLSEGLGISQQTAHYLLNTSFDTLSSLNAKIVHKMLDDYKANIGKLVI